MNTYSGPNVLKLFNLLFTNFRDKLECLSLTSFSTLGKAGVSLRCSTLVALLTNIEEARKARQGQTL
jgi:hypothetical protein